MAISQALHIDKENLDVWDPVTHDGALKAVNIIEGRSDTGGQEFLVQILFAQMLISGLQPMLDMLA